MVGKTDGCLLLGLLGWVGLTIQERYRENSNIRWASEAVQIGGRGSGLGFIGLWTNAEYQLSEPVGAHPTTLHYTHSLISSLSIGAVGPFWSWKVGPPDVFLNLAQRSQALGPSHNAGGSNRTDDAQSA